jgi:hypothetical protein
VGVFLSFLSDVSHHFLVAWKHDAVLGCCVLRGKDRRGAAGFCEAECYLPTPTVPVVDMAGQLRASMSKYFALRSESTLGVLYV